MNRIKCFLYGHVWSTLYRIAKTSPSQYRSHCINCLKLTKPIIYEREIDLNHSLGQIGNILELIEENLRKEKATKSKLIKIDEEISINIYYVESIKRNGKLININMLSQDVYQVLYTKKDWLKLHALTK